MVVAFTGYRPEKMPFQESKKDKRYLAFRAILSRVISRLIELGGTYCISGVARGFDIPVLAQVRNRPFYGGQRHGEILRNPLFGRPALTVRICSVAEVHIKRNCSARKIVAVNGIEITHGSSSGRGALWSLAPSGMSCVFSFGG